MMTIMYETMSCFGQMFVGALFGRYTFFSSSLFVIFFDAEYLGSEYTSSSQPTWFCFSSNVQSVYVIQSIQASLQITYANKLDLP